jgi:polyphosphate glucokinase
MPLTQETSGERDVDSSARKILAIDIGGTKVKMLLNGATESRKVPSGLEFTPPKLVAAVKETAADWHYDAISIGYPGLTGLNGPLAEPHHLGPGWMAFDFTAAFGKPVKVINDAALQAIGSYEGGRMLFLGFGTGLGSCLIADGVLLSLELSNLRWNARATIGDVVGKPSLKKVGRRRWRKHSITVIDFLSQAFVADYVVVGGGNAKYLRGLPPGVRRGHNQAAFRGGYRIWEWEGIPTAADAVRNQALRILY